MITVPWFLVEAHLWSTSSWWWPSHPRFPAAHHRSGRVDQWWGRMPEPWSRIALIKERKKKRWTRRRSVTYYAELRSCQSRFETSKYSFKIETRCEVKEPFLRRSATTTQVMYHITRKKTATQMHKLRVGSTRVQPIVRHENTSFRSETDNLNLERLLTVNWPEFSAQFVWQQLQVHWTRPLPLFILFWWFFFPFVGFYLSPLVSCRENKDV